MPQYTMMSYNIEHMRKMFNKNNVRKDSKTRLQKVAKIIKNIDPHILGVVEASNKLKHHEVLVNDPDYLNGRFQIAKSEVNRGSQDLVVYYRDPFEVLEVDTNVDFYAPWLEDIDDDGIQELCDFERVPLEILFRIKGTDIRFYLILILSKSKGVFAVNDLLTYQRMALSNRKKLFAQAKKIRRRLDQILDMENPIPVIVMGDMNDEPGLDEYQKQVGASSIETLMGSIFDPKKIMHNALWHLSSDDHNRELWTAEFPDQIVSYSKNHRVWIDHILVSPDMIVSESKFRYVMDSGSICQKDEIAKAASDHYPIFCQFEHDE